MKPLKQLNEDFLAYMETVGRSKHTIRMQRHCVSKALRWLEETQSVTGPDQLNRPHLELWVKTIRSHRTTKGQPLTITSVAKHFDTNRLFIQWLEANGALPAGIHAIIPKVKIPDLLPTSVLTHEQMEALLMQVDITNTDGFQLRARLEFLYTSGVRVAEMLSLDLGSIDLSGRTARVMGKGQKERVVPFGLTSAEFIEGYLSGLRPLRLRDPFEVGFWLDRLGQRMPYHTFRRNLIDLVSGMDLPENVSAHTIRRSCATVLIRGGANLWHVRDMFGHESVETLRPYVRLQIDDLKKTHAKCHPREQDYRDEKQSET